MKTDAIRQGKHPSDFFRTPFVSDPENAQAKLYYDIS
jgi:hypothetical protein